MKIDKAIKTLDLDTPKEVAHFLRDAGITGERDESMTCPVALYLHRETGLDPIYVYGKTVHLSRYHGSLGLSQKFRLPKAVRKFIKRFDSGKYDYLAD